MGLFKRKEDERKNLPNLPGMSKLPDLPPLPSMKSDISALPSFSRNDFSSPSGMGIQAIKATIRDGSQKGLEYTPKEEFKSIDVSDKESVKFAMSPRNFSREPVFVKLDKFKEATEKFSEVKQKVLEIEDSLRKLKEIKEKEDAELKSWDEEMQLIRQKVDAIDNSLFNKL